MFKVNDRVMVTATANDGPHFRLVGKEAVVAQASPYGLYSIRLDGREAMWLLEEELVLLDEDGNFASKEA